MKFLRPGDMDDKQPCKRLYLTILCILIATIATMLALGTILP